MSNSLNGNWLMPHCVFCSSRYYDGDQDSLFDEAHVVSPYKKDSSRPNKVNRSYQAVFNPLYANDFFYLV